MLGAFAGETSTHEFERYFAHTAGDIWLIQQEKSNFYVQHQQQHLKDSQ